MSLAEQLEVSFVTNRLSRRIYVQVADDSSGEVGVRAQKAALMAIRDGFKNNDRARSPDCTGIR